MHLFGSCLWAATAALALPTPSVKTTVRSLSPSPAISLSPRENLQHRRFEASNDVASLDIRQLARRSFGEAATPEPQPPYEEQHQDSDSGMTSEQKAELPILLGMLEDQFRQLKPHQRVFYHACREGLWQNLPTGQADTPLNICKTLLECAIRASNDEVILPQTAKRSRPKRTSKKKKKQSKSPVQVVQDGLAAIMSKLPASRGLAPGIPAFAGSPVLVVPRR
ncbi:MAG: hypothetical protein M1816_007025 [Peltula sp. TS41687]|nr:MAG: hypothetical protein M1816_007025 [Peltula sp. TS41687]